MAEVEYLDALDVISLHPVALEHGGGAAGVRDVAALEAAVARPQMAAYYEHRDLVGQGTLLVGLAVAHPFVDGNKRVALLATLTFWELIGLTFSGSAQELAEQLVEIIARGEDRNARIAAVEAWVRENLLPTERT